MEECEGDGHGQDPRESKAKTSARQRLGEQRRLDRIPVKLPVSTVESWYDDGHGLTCGSNQAQILLTLRSEHPASELEQKYLINGAAIAESTIRETKVTVVFSQSKQYGRFACKQGLS